MQDDGDLVVYDAQTPVPVSPNHSISCVWATGSFSSTSEIDTPPQFISGHPLEFLDMFDIAANRGQEQGYVMQGWQMQPDSIDGVSQPLDVMHVWRVGRFNGMIRSAATACNDTAGKALCYLDRHPVFCSASEVLIDWRMTDCKSHGSRIQYQCMEMKDPLTCTQSKTTIATGATGSLDNLEKYRVSCDRYEYLQGFKMHHVAEQGPQSNQAYFGYTCCKST